MLAKGKAPKVIAKNASSKLLTDLVEGSHAHKACVTRPVRVDCWKDSLFESVKRLYMAVFVLDRKGKALMPCTEKRARLLLSRARARVHKLVPFVIRLRDRDVADCAVQVLDVKIDPGSQVTGIAVVRVSVRVAGKVASEVQAGVESQSDQRSQAQRADPKKSAYPKKSAHVLHLIELLHRGRQISEALTARSQMRRRRRANLRYRAPRFLNRRNKQKGWLAPSLQHRVNTTLSWVRRLMRYAPVTTIVQELVRFDLHALQAQAEGHDISGVQYQQGTLFGYEVREYLLEKFQRTCLYCSTQGVPLQIEHIYPKSKGGSDRISNLGLACQACNQKKGAQDVRVFLAKDPIRLKRVLAQAKAPLKDAAAVNSTRWALFESLKATALEVNVASGGRTKFNRSTQGVPKTHALDAACVGDVSSVMGWNKPTLNIQCTGRGSYQRTRLNKFGFPRGYLMRTKSVKGFQTGDLVKAVVTKGKKVGAYAGRVAVRASGSFNIQTSTGLVQGISYKCCTVVQRADGYGYQQVAKMDATGKSPKPGTLARSALYLPGLNAEVSRAK